jgi:Zn-finger nucleic acid-binding protein
MAGRGIADIPVQECPGCRGLWVPGQRFNELMNRVVEAQKARPTDGLGWSPAEPPGTDSPRRGAFSTRVVYRRCPSCDGIMQRKNFAKRSGVIIDLCAKHGVWLDADELEALADFIRQGGLESVSMVSEHWDSKEFLSGDEKRIEGLIEAERILARERAVSRRRRGVLSEGSSSDVLGTLGDLLRRFLE